jgi:hypothetical protein
MDRAGVSSNRLHASSPVPPSEGTFAHGSLLRQRMTCPRDEAGDGVGHCKFVPASDGKTVLAVLTPEEPAPFERAKGGKDRAPAHTPSERRRMRILLDERKQPGFRHAST